MVEDDKHDHILPSPLSTPQPYFRTLHFTDHIGEKRDHAPVELAVVASRNVHLAKGIVKFQK